MLQQLMGIAGGHRRRREERGQFSSCKSIIVSLRAPREEVSSKLPSLLGLCFLSCSSCFHLTVGEFSQYFPSWCVPALGWSWLG